MRCDAGDPVDLHEELTSLSLPADELDSSPTGHHTEVSSLVAELSTDVA